MFNDAIKKAEQEHGLGGGDYFKVKDGDNRIRVLSAPIFHESEYQGKPTKKFVAWVIDRRDGEIKPYFMPVKVARGIAALEEDQDWAYDTLPMPYDINIKAENAGDVTVQYSINPSPKRTELTAEEQKAFAEKPTIEEYLATLEEKKQSESQPATAPQSTEAKTTIKSHTGDDIAVDDVPFK